MTQTLMRTTITTPTDREIRIERIVNAPRDRVWRAYTEPALIAQWWGRGNKLVIEREVSAPTRFVRSFEWDGMPAHVAIETVTMEDLGDGRTQVVITMQMHTPEERDGFLQSGMQGGMDAAFAALDRLVEEE